MNVSAYIPFYHKVSFVDKLLFTKHLSVMIKSGITISEALDTLSSQTTSGYFKKITDQVLSDIENGETFANALLKHPDIYDDFYISLIKIGEESGTLEENLEFLAKQLSKDYALRKKIQGAMLYPGIILTATLVMGLFISFFIMPKLLDLFNQFQTDLPFFTRILLAFATGLKNYGAFIFIGLLILSFIFSFSLRIPAVRFTWHKTLLKMPLVGKLILYSQLANFSRNLGTLLKSGVPVISSLETTANTLSNVKFKSDLTRVAKEVTKGESISVALNKKRFNEFPPIVIKMIGVGEKTGKLDETLLYLGDFYEDEIDDISKNLSTVLEPILLIGIGLVVGFVALAVISPIYQLTGSLKR